MAAYGSLAHSSATTTPECRSSRPACLVGLSLGTAWARLRRAEGHAEGPLRADNGLQRAGRADIPRPGARDGVAGVGPAQTGRPLPLAAAAHWERSSHNSPGVVSAPRPRRHSSSNVGQIFAVIYFEARASSIFAGFPDETVPRTAFGTFGTFGAFGAFGAFAAARPWPNVNTRARWVGRGRGKRRSGSLTQCHELLQQRQHISRILKNSVTVEEKPRKTRLLNFQKF